ncbi:MAG: hypothetical protein UX68_C0004G0015 [Parcubacteria group bacterium GW2011_GWA2_46_9]|nr:MAG: hypothetical protein UX68_C0004G0015 [Parcubacteria group bacterium GW2011_GWA2_46_9]
MRPQTKLPASLSSIMQDITRVRVGRNDQTAPKGNSAEDIGLQTPPRHSGAGITRDLSEISRVGPSIVSATPLFLMRSIPVKLGEHQLSPHVIKLQSRRTPPPPTLLEPLVVGRESRWFYWMNEISVLSILGFLFLFGIVVAKHIFRIPVLEISQTLKTGRFPLPKQEEQSSFKLAPFKASLQTASVLFERPNQEFNRIPWSQVAAIAIVGFIILAPLRFTAEAVRMQAVRAEAVDAAAAGLTSFVAGGQAVIDYDFLKAGNEFEVAVNRFQDASLALNNVPTVLKMLATALPQGQEPISGEYLLEAGAALARVGQKVSHALIFLNQSNGATTDFSAAKFLVDLSAAASEIQPDLDEAIEAISKVRFEDVPIEHRPALEKVHALLPVIKSGVNQLLRLNEIMPDLLGLQGRRRYLVMFQNNHELRASGGFMGSFAVVDVQDGKIQSLNVPSGGTYDLQGSLVPRLLAPEPLWLINPRWEFQDANWWSDWPTSAKKIAWFYRQAGGESVDGVIAIDIDLMESLLKITGPIPMPAYNLTLTADNFATETQAEVEIRYDKQVNRPKQFIADLAPLLIGRLEADLRQNGLRVAEALSRALTEKHLLIYRDEPDIESRLKDLNWAGAVPSMPPLTDIIGIVHTNIAGGKSDAVISDKVEHSVVKQTNGTLIDTLTITRTHTGSKGEQFSGVRNVDYLRVYVPAGSRLIEAQGFTAPPESLYDTPPPDLMVDEDLGNSLRNLRRDDVSGVSIYEEFGRTVFANWLMVDPGESTTVTLRYELPWRLNGQIDNSWEPWSSYFGWSEKTNTYRLRWDKQPGTGPTIFTHSFSSATPIHFRFSSVKVSDTEHGWEWKETLNSDTSLSVTYVD